MSGLPKGVRKKTAKGHTYYYFDTGQTDDKGKAIMKRLPDIRDTGFGRALADAQRGRTMRAQAKVEMTVSRMIGMFEKSREFRAFADASRTIYTTYLKQLNEVMGDAPVDDVRAADVRIMRDKMADRPGAANMAVRTLGSLYKWGRAHEHTTVNPVKGVEFLEQGEHEPWPEWLIEEALSCDEARIQLATALLYFTAQRIGDVLRMRWSDIRNGAIEVRQKKTKLLLDLRIHSRLAEILARTPKSGMTIAAQENGKPWAQSTIREALQEFATARGVKVVPHGLRKNAVNALLEAGCSAAETAAISGQSLLMVEHYARRRNVKALGNTAILKWEAKK